jgi:pyruvate-formate lyase
MAHKRNTEAVVKKAKEKTAQSIERVEKAIREMSTANEPINVARVAEQSGVSRQWIYKNEAILSRIKRLSEQGSTKKVVVKKSQVRSESSKDAIIATLQARVKSLEEENSELKSQLQVAYGELYDKQ